MSGRPPPNIDGMTSLKIDNLSYRTDMDTLRRKFEKYGEIGDVYVPKDKYGGKCPSLTNLANWIVLMLKWQPFFLI